jgi:alpha-methylacyl-CoA racemase
MADGPLAGIRIVELTGLGPAPYACMLLAELGADVIRIDRPSAAGVLTPDQALRRSRPCVALDLTDPRGRDTALALVARADALVEGWRPGVAERLGLGPDDCLAANPRLVYARMTGWGQDGPLAPTAGHDINYASITGALHAIGPREAPIPPLNLVADFGGGSMFLIMGVLAALLERERSGRGQVVDAAMVDGAASLITMVHGMLALGAWRDERAANLLDGGAPFYRTYACADGRHVAVGALEPQFYAALLAGLELTGMAGEQYDQAHWPAHEAALAAAFAGRTRDEWAARFAGTDACVTPVLSLTEAPGHPQLAGRGTYADVDGTPQPAPAPRFSRSAPAIRSGPRRAGQDTRAALAAWSIPAAEIDDLIAAGVAVDMNDAGPDDKDGQ